MIIVFNHFVDVHREFYQPDVTEYVETGHSHLNSRTYLSIAKEYLKSVTCVIKPVKCHDHAYLFGLMVIRLLSFMHQHTHVLHT